MQADWLDRVARTILGEHLSPKNLEAFVSKARNIDLPRGSFLFREGEVNHHVFLLLEGQLDLSMTVPGRGVQRILSLGPGELVAWSAVVGDGIMTCSANCVQPAHLIAVESQALDSLIEEDPVFGSEFMKSIASALAKRLLATRLQLLDLFAPHDGMRKEGFV